MSAESDDGALNCCPEWCELGIEPHDETCPAHPMLITKGEFVEALEAAATHALFAYTIDADTLDEATRRSWAVGEVQEAAICRAGIGSCGRGWCHHS